MVGVTWDPKMPSGSRDSRVDATTRKLGRRTLLLRTTQCKTSHPAERLGLVTCCVINERTYRGATTPHLFNSASRALRSASRFANPASSEPLVGNAGAICTPYTPTKLGEGAYCRRARDLKYTTRLPQSEQLDRRGPTGAGAAASCE